MSRQLTNAFTLFISVIGSIIALFLTVKHYLPNIGPGCNVGPGGCSGVLTSAYSQIGPVPIALFGFAMYATVIALCLKRKSLFATIAALPPTNYTGSPVTEAVSPEAEAANRELSEGGISPAEDDPVPAPVVPAPNPEIALRETELTHVNQMVWMTALAGTCISWWLQYAALYKLESFCPYCFSSALLITLVLLIAARDHFLHGQGMNGEQKLVTGVCVFLGLALFMVYGPNIYIQYQVVKSKGFVPEDGPNLLSRRVLLAPNMHTMGDPNAPVHLIEFADLQCKFCAKASKEVKEILAQNKGKLKLSYRHFLIPSHQWTLEASLAVEAAGVQNKFWELQTLIFKNQEQMEAPEFTATMFDLMAQQVGLNMEQYKKDKEDPRAKARIMADVDAGKQSRLNITPTFFAVTAKKIFRFEGLDELKAALNNPRHEMWESKEPADAPQNEPGQMQGPQRNASAEG